MSGQEIDMKRRDFLKAMAALGSSVLVEPHSLAGSLPVSGDALTGGFNAVELATLRRFFVLEKSVTEDTEFRNEVAQIALSEIQSRLPQWAVVIDGNVTRGRQAFDESVRSIHLLRYYLFTINWADTAPGISWPEAYHATYIPGFDKYLVTASQDSDDQWGVTEIAIGWFASNVQIEEGCKQVLTTWWAAQRDGWGQARWADVWGTGEISDKTAYSWDESVWGAGPD